MLSEPFHNWNFQSIYRESRVSLLKFAFWLWILVMESFFLSWRKELWDRERKREVEREFSQSTQKMCTAHTLCSPSKSIYWNLSEFLVFSLPSAYTFTESAWISFEYASASLILFNNQNISRKLVPLLLLFFCIYCFNSSLKLAFLWNEHGNYTFEWNNID